MGDTPFLDDALFELNELELIIKSFKVASPKAPITLFYVDGFSPGGDRHFFYPTSNVKHNSNFVLNEYRRCLQLDGSISPLVFVCSCNTDQNGYPSHWTHEEKSATLVNPKLNLVYRKGTCGILANTGEIVVSPSLI